MYGMQILAQNSRKSTAWFAAVRTVLLALFSREMYGLLLLYICNQFGTEKKKGVRLVCWAHFPEFEIKFAGGDKLYFSPFSVLYFAEE